MAEVSGRRLSAIMFSDVVGYTELTERDEARALRARDRHRARLRPLAEQFEGELLESPGDECLSVFASARQAVGCALALQAGLRGDPDLRLRIGIHVGDVLLRDGELIGEGVNVAARIRALAEPGGVCVSEQVWKLVRGQEHLAARSLGPQRLKNVSQAVEVLALDSAPLRGHGRPWWQGWKGWSAAALSLLLGLGWWYRAPLVVGAVFLAPKVFASPVHQDLGFASTADGVQIAYATSGRGPPLLYVLGWITHLENGAASPLYDQPGLIELASREHLFVRYDGRGFGMSDRHVTDFGLDARVHDIEAVADALHLERFGIWAISAGAPAAVAYTARHPDRVSRLVLAGSAASTSEMSADDRAHFERVLALVESDWGSPGVPEMFSSLLSRGQHSEIFNAIGAEFMRRSADGPELAGFMRAQLAIDINAEARAVRVPTLVMHARDDEVIPFRQGRELASLIPGARFEVVDGGHFESTGGTRDTAKRILAFFAEDAR